MLKFREFYSQVNERTAQLVGPSGIIAKMRAADDWNDLYMAMKELTDPGREAIRLGKGSYGIAFTGNTGGPAVLKISRSLGEHEPIVRFFEYCKKKPTNPMFPKIFAYEIKPDRSYWVIMEKLSGIANHFSPKDSSNVTRNFGRIDWEQSEPIMMRQLRVEIQSNIYHNRDPLTGLFVRNPTDEQKKNMADFIDFIRILDTFGGTNDIHSENVGYRANGQMVIFDPLS